MKFVFVSFLALAALTNKVEAATLVNGSLNGAPAVNGVPSGWTKFNTADTVGAVSERFFLTYPGLSPDGGSWVGFATERSIYFESITQTVDDFDVGSNYVLSWYATNTGCCSSLTPPFDEANTIFLSLNGSTVFHSEPLERDGNWYRQEYNFEASSTSYSITFGASVGARSYLGIDGITLASASIPAVPLPASGLFLLSGLVFIRFASGRSSIAHL